MQLRVVMRAAQLVGWNLDSGADYVTWSRNVKLLDIIERKKSKYSGGKQGTLPMCNWHIKPSINSLRGSRGYAFTKT